MKVKEEKGGPVNRDRCLFMSIDHGPYTAAGSGASG